MIFLMAVFVEFGWSLGNDFVSKIEPQSIIKLILIGAFHQKVTTITMSSQYTSELQY